MSESLTIAGVSFSLSQQPQSLEAWEAQLFEEIAALRADGAALIVYPELFLLGLTAFMPQKTPREELTAVAAYLEKNLLPAIERRFAAPGFCLVLGSGPRQTEGGSLRNTAFILLEGRWIFQDKIYLTPWEGDFEPGTALEIFSFLGLRTAVMICFDIEHPGLASLLKKSGIELILVPSATSDRNGNQRVNRCASARSIELGAAVLTVPLIGQGAADLIDHSEGRQGFFLPAQTSIRAAQEAFSPYSQKEQLRQKFVCSPSQLLALKEPSAETRPFMSPENREIELRRTGERTS